MQRTKKHIVALAITFTILINATGCSESAPDIATARGTATFVGRQLCAECHEAQSLAFTGSDHDLAMQPATVDTVLADFDDTSFTHSGVTSTFQRRGDSFVVRTDGSDGEMHEYPIAYTFGVYPLQQYLVEMENGYYQALGFCWDTRPTDEGGQRWFHLYGDEKIDNHDELHWTKPLQNWNYMCSECHSTNLEKGYKAAEDLFNTTWSEVNVSCEACHGPGSNHVSWAREVQSGEKPTDTNGGLMVRLSAPDESYWTFDEGATTAHRTTPLVNNLQVETCGRCHARRTQIWPEYQHGQPLADSHRVALLDEYLYHADGQILDEVYVYGSFLQSRMYHQGVTCTDCHEAHSTSLLGVGNGLCVRCHLASSFDTPEHHFHQEGTAGALCVDCHMPAQNYMVVDPRRDHSLRVPRPDLSVKLGTPNACNDCHNDRSAQWASEAVENWFGPDRQQKFHYGQAIDAGRRGDVGAASLLLQVIDDSEVPGIARATAVSLLRNNLDNRSLAAIEHALGDEDPLIRRAAVGLLDAVDPQTRRRLGTPLLNDPIRSVRMEAVSVLAGAITEDGDPKGFDDFNRAVEEFRKAQWFNASRAESHINLGNLETRLGHASDAEAAYRRAISMQPSFIPAYVNLADLLRAVGRDKEGERVLRDALVIAPENATVHHTLGLLLIRLKSVDEALEHLAIAVTQGPENTRYAFVYGIALHDLGNANSALMVLEQAHTLSPADRNVLQLLVVYNKELGNNEIASRWALKLDALSSSD